MDWYTWIPLLVVSGIIAVRSFVDRGNQQKASLCFHYFGIHPGKELSQVQLVHMKHVLRDLYNDMHECGEVLCRYRERDIRSGGQEKLLQSTIIEAEFEFEKAEFSYSTALDIAVHFAPKGFGVQVEEYIHPTTEEAKAMLNPAA